MLQSKPLRGKKHMTRRKKSAIVKTELEKFKIFLEEIPNATPIRKGGLTVR